MPYEYEHVLEFIDKAKIVWDTEKYMLKLLNKYHYVPKIKFRGSRNECFRLPEKKLLSLFSLMN